MDLIPNSILEWIAQLGITVGATVLTAYAAFKGFSTRWLDNKFAERLERYKDQLTRESNKEIEHLKYQINALMDRTTKLHQHEFEVLPEVWSKLGAALVSVKDFTARVKTIPDLNMMSQAELTEFIESCNLMGWQKNQIIGSEDKNEYYREAIFWHDLYDVHKKHAEFHNYFISKGIFIQPELKEKIRDLSNIMYDAFTEREHYKRYPIKGPGQFEKGDFIQHQGFDMLHAIEKEVQSRLWEANKLETQP